jgi:hypothetical protein
MHTLHAYRQEYARQIPWAKKSIPRCCEAAKKAQTPSSAVQLAACQTCSSDVMCGGILADSALEKARLLPALFFFHSMI